ncbi:MAG TPA: hypothetical protein VKR43_23340 [Bryobacteraceae bacterium]|nr:hypothetical protein [Bryobacteraceae bacterium]
MRPRIMYIESKAESLNGPATIGRVTFSKTGSTLYYKDREFLKVGKSGYKYNYIDTNSREEYWISGPRRDGKDRLYVSNQPVDIDEDVRGEYWTQIRRRPDLIAKKHT